MGTLKSPLFIICSALFLLHQLAQHGIKRSFPLADDYLDNLLAMPIILTLLLAERRQFFRRGKNYRLPILEIILATIYVSVISEWVFPRLSNRFTFDPVDFLVFFAGTGLFYLLQGQAEERI